MKHFLKLIVFLILFHFVLFNSQYVFGECIEGDCINGEGTWRIEKGITYKGQFQNNMFNGKGTFYDSNSNAKYVGYFKNNHCSGQGVLTWDDGTKFEGIFKYDILIKGQRADPDGSVHTIALPESEIEKLNQKEKNQLPPGPRRPSRTRWTKSPSSAYGSTKS